MAHLKDTGLPVHPELLKAWQDRALKAEATIKEIADVAIALDEENADSDDLIRAVGLAKAAFPKGTDS